MAWPYLSAPFMIVLAFLSFQTYHNQNGEEEVHPKALRP
jgi:hypothetical protein